MVSRVGSPPKVSIWISSQGGNEWLTPSAVTELTAHWRAHTHVCTYTHAMTHLDRKGKWRTAKTCIYVPKINCTPLKTMFKSRANRAGTFQNTRWNVSHIQGTLYYIHYITYSGDNVRKAVASSKITNKVIP